MNDGYADSYRDEDLLTISAFAARARLSAKALRLYDRLGLLAPAHVDEANGYRYYRAAQVERARLVALLRQLDMPLALIGELVELVESDGPVESCVPVADEAAARAWVTAVRVEPARRLAYTRISKAQVAHPQIIAAFEAVERWMSGQGIEAAGPCREVYFADWEAAGPDDAVCDIAFPVGS